MAHPARTDSPDLLLVNTPLKALGAPGSLYPSLANLTLGSFLARQGFDIALLDPTVDLVGLSDVAQADPAAVFAATLDEILRINPSALGLTTMGHIEGGFAVAVAQAIRAKNATIPIVIGGSWATGYADLILSRFDCIDAVAIASGEHSAKEALSKGLGRGTLEGSCRLLAETPGWIARDSEGRIIKTDPTVRLEPTDSPPLDLSLLANPDRYDTAVYLTSRGCPYSCAFCTEPFMFHSQMHEPLDKIEADLHGFDQQLDASYLWLCDPLFGSKRRRLDELLPLLSQSRLSYLYESRVDTLPPDEVPRIRASGGDLIYLGLEATSVRSLLQIQKVSSEAEARRYLDSARELVPACIANDVVPVIGVLNPVPGDQMEDLETTLAFLGELNGLSSAAADRSGSEARPFFYAFPYRIDRGTEAAATWERDAKGLGCTANVPEDELFIEREIWDASPSVDREAAAAFRQKVRALNRGGPAIMKRVLRSMPRPFLSDRWMEIDGTR